MAKDPAFLFYPNDWLGGTIGMTFEQKGAYMELLMVQFNRGHMTLHMVTHTVGQLWGQIQDKFKLDENGLWYNERLDLEKQKRAKFTESSDNLLGTNNNQTKSRHKEPHMEDHMDVHMENENENRNKDKKKGGKGGNKKPAFVPPTCDQVVAYFLEKGYSEEAGKKAFNFYASADWIDSKGNKVLSWKQKMVGIWFKEENRPKSEIKKMVY